MELVFVIAVVLCLWLFIYEGILLPSIRIKLKYKLYALRDQLRILKVKHKDKISPQTFHSLDNYLSTSIVHIPILTYRILREVKKDLEKDPELKKQIDRKVELIKNSEVSQMRDIYDKMIKYSVYGLLANGGGWFIYLAAILIPVLIIAFVVGSLGILKKKCRDDVQDVLLVPEKEVSKHYSYAEIQPVS